MGADDPASLELLREHLGPDLTELQKACTTVLTSTQLVWNPNASDSELVACLKDLIDEMATVTGSKLMWSPHESELREDRASRSSSRRSSSSVIGSKAKKELGASALHLVCNCDETMTDARVLQAILPPTLPPTALHGVPYTLQSMLLHPTPHAASNP